MSDLVGNPEDPFSHVAAHICNITSLLLASVAVQSGLKTQRKGFLMTHFVINNGTDHFELLQSLISMFIVLYLDRMTILSAAELQNQ